MIKNYTSTVSLARSIAHIEERLVKHGARQTVKTYTPGGDIEAFCFVLLVNGKEVPFKLPARMSNCEAILKKQVVRPKPGTMDRVHEQAERTAWKLVSDWVDIQLSFVELGQAEIMEVLLPYVYDHATGKTFFEKLKGSEFKMIGMDKINNERSET